MSALQKAKWSIAQKLELAWWKRYLADKDVASYLAWKKEYWLKFLSDLEDKISLNPNAKILDAGCGPAGIFTVLKQETTAVDPLLDSYAEEIPHFTPSHYSNVRFVTSALENYNAVDEFDTIFCLNAINHTKHIEKSCAILYNALKPDGELVLSTDLHCHTFLKWIFKLLPGDALHPQQHTLADYKEMLHQTGFEIKADFAYNTGYVFNYHIFVLKRTTK